jgi:hypothetical protein
MKDTINELQRELEQATSCGAATEGELREETAQLRETWLAFGRLLEAASPPTQPTFHHWTMPRARSKRWLVPALAAVAASLLAMAAISGIWRAGARSGQPDGGQEQASKSALPPPAVKPPLEAIVQGPAPAPRLLQAESAANAAEAVVAIEWDDSFDEQVVEVGRRVVRVQEEWSSHSAARALVQQGLEQVRLDLEGNPL